MNNFNIKAFLNKDGIESIAAIGVNIEDKEEDWKVGDIIISDCNKVINLTMGFDSKEELENNIFKIDNIINVLIKTKSYLLLNTENYIKDIKKREDELAKKANKK
jgi:hypothetical protein